MALGGGRDPFAGAGATSEARLHSCRPLEGSRSGRGDVCAVIMRHHQSSIGLHGGSRVGGAATVLAYPNSALPSRQFRHGIEGMLDAPV